MPCCTTARPVRLTDSTGESSAQGSPFNRAAGHYALPPFLFVMVAGNAAKLYCLAPWTGSAAGIAPTAGYLGAALSPLIGMGLLGLNPGLGFIFWGGGYILSGRLFLVVQETGRSTA